MPQSFDTVFSGGTVVNCQTRGLADIGVRDGRVAAIGDLGLVATGRRIDCTGLHLLPGVIDSQVHFREPGFEHKEDLATGSRAAVLGGVTAVFEMPNTSPSTTNEPALRDKLTRADGRMYCDHAFWIGGTRENSAALPDLERLPGVAGIKLFMGSSTGDLLVEDDAAVASILQNARRRVAVHSEDEFRLRDRLDLRRAGDPASHPIWRDEIVAIRSTERLVTLARKSGARVHVLHVSTAEEIAFLSRHKDVATLEVTPHHLTLSSDDYSRLGARLQMNPPIRAAHHRAALWKSIAASCVDVLGSDHAPHTLEEKAQSYPRSPSGMPGVETHLSIMLDHVNAGRLSLECLVALTSDGPRRIFGIENKGRLEIGYDADISIVDLKHRHTITNGEQASRSGWTPYDGRTVRVGQSALSSGAIS